jgi:non-ribosomal peptide synthetase component F
MTLLAAFQVLLHRYSGQEKISVGIPVAGRNRTETQSMIGFFVNTLVMCGDLSGNPGFREVLRRVREICLGAYAHQDVPFEKIVEALQPDRSLVPSPLFQVWFVLHSAARENVRLDDVTSKNLGLNIETAQFDLNLSLTEGSKQIGGGLIYDTDLFDADTIAEMLKDFRSLLKQVTADPERRILDITLGAEEFEPSAQDTLGLQVCDDAEDQFTF